MPSRAYASFLPCRKGLNAYEYIVCQCPHGLIPHFYALEASIFFGLDTGLCQCPHGLMPHFYDLNVFFYNLLHNCVNALTGLYLISTWEKWDEDIEKAFCVNALTGLCLISTGNVTIGTTLEGVCQCPLGLIPHFYWHTRSRAVPTSGVCQCPHGLIPHFYEQLRSVVDWQKEVCQCPHRLIPHFYMNNNGTPDNIWDDTCQCPHRLIPHFYSTPSKT